MKSNHDATVEKTSIIQKKEHKGRVKGTPNKKTLLYQDVLDRHDIEPADLLCFIYKGDFKSLNLPEKTFRVGFAGQEYEEYTISLEMRLDASKTLMMYKYPKRKAVEYSVADATKGVFTLNYSDASLKDEPTK